MLDNNNTASSREQGPVAGNIQLGLQGLADLMSYLPDQYAPEARRHLESLFEACEVVNALEGYLPPALPVIFSWRVADRALAHLNANRRKNRQPELRGGHA